MLVLFFVTDQGSHFVKGAVLGLRIVVPEALRRPFGRLLRQRHYGSSQTLRRPYGQLLLAAAILQRSSVCSCGADKLYCRSRLWEALSWVRLARESKIGLHGVCLDLCTSLQL